MSWPETVERGELRWLFFDLGSTLVDESECYRRRYAEIVEGTCLSSEAFERKAIEFAKQNRKGDRAAAQFYGLALPQWHTELEQLYPGAEAVLSALTERGYRLGVIANQPPGARRRLENWGNREILRWGHGLGGGGRGEAGRGDLPQGAVCGRMPIGECRHGRRPAGQRHRARPAAGHEGRLGSTGAGEIRRAPM